MATFENQETAAFDALELAFRFREQYLEKKNQPSNFKFKSRWHKAARKEVDERPTLGERAGVDMRNKEFDF